MFVRMGPGNVFREPTSYTTNGVEEQFVIKKAKVDEMRGLKVLTLPVSFFNLGKCRMENRGQIPDWQRCCSSGITQFPSFFA